VWFFLDICSLLPSAGDFLDFGGETGPDGETVQGSASEAVLLLRMVRAARLIKLVRLLKYKRIYMRMVTRVSISHSLGVKIRVAVAVFLVSHWFACIFALSATLHSDPRETYWFIRNFCGDESRDASGGSWPEDTHSSSMLESCRLTAGRFYIASITYAHARARILHAHA